MLTIADKADILNLIKNINNVSNSHSSLTSSSRLSSGENSPKKNSPTTGNLPPYQRNENINNFDFSNNSSKKNILSPDSQWDQETLTTPLNQDGC